VASNVFVGSVAFVALSADAEYEYGWLNRVDRDASMRLGGPARPESGSVDGSAKFELRRFINNLGPQARQCRRRDAEDGDEGDCQFIRSYPDSRRS
jgi:hypothetical protein